MARSKSVERRGTKRAPLFGLLAQEIFADLMALLPEEDIELLVSDMLTESWTELELASPTEYGEYNANDVYVESTSSDSRTELDSDLDFVEDDDVAHEFDT
jgi:hypothetical protein